MSSSSSMSYDALDRFVAVIPSGKATVRRFYNRGHLATELLESHGLCIFRNADFLLAQHRIESSRTLTALIATDHQCSVLNELEINRNSIFAYTPYGYRSSAVVMSSLLAFNAEPPDAVTGHYLLGNGHRGYNPVLMRFNSPDKLSPFGRGGLNAFAYCNGDPVNFIDPSGQFLQVIFSALKMIRLPLKTVWKTYSLVLRPSGVGLGRAATLVSRTGYVTTATGWGIQASGYTVGASVSGFGGSLIAAGKVLKVADKLMTVVRNGKFTAGVSNRVRQVRSFFRPAASDLERGNIRDQ